MLYREEAYRIIGACFEVYNDKGCGFLEAVYQECLEIEFRHQKIPHEPQPRLPLTYRGIPLKKKYRPDFICYGAIVVELKSASSLCSGDQAQMLNYLNATGYQIGLLVNFGHYPGLEHKRIVLTKRDDMPSKIDPNSI